MIARRILRKPLDDMPKKPIHPTFYPFETGEGGLWQYGGRSAPTLRELLQKLPEGTQILDYYPKESGGLPPQNFGDTGVLRKIVTGINLKSGVAPF